MHQLPEEIQVGEFDKEYGRPSQSWVGVVELLIVVDIGHNIHGDRQKTWIQSQLFAEIQIADIGIREDRANGKADAGKEKKPIIELNFSVQPYLQSHTSCSSYHGNAIEESGNDLNSSAIVYHTAIALRN